MRPRKICGWHYKDVSPLEDLFDYQHMRIREKKVSARSSSTQQKVEASSTFHRVLEDVQ